MADGTPFKFAHLSFNTVTGALDFEQIGLGLTAVTNTPLGNALHDVQNIADSALAMFRGIYPIEAPYFWWGEGLHLPWHERYWTESGDGETLTPLDVSAEVTAMASTLRAQVASEDFESTIITFLADGFSTPQRKVQGLAVEVLMMADVCVGHLVADQLLEAVNSLSATYHRLIEATHFCVEILDSAKANARTAAGARHTENRQMKAQVMEWYAKHHSEYRSMDAAAEAVAGKLVPVTFRTARDWIGQAKKNLRSARTP